MDHDPGVCVTYVVSVDRSRMSSLFSDRGISCIFSDQGVPSLFSDHAMSSLFPGQVVSNAGLNYEPKLATPPYIDPQHHTYILSQQRQSLAIAVFEVHDGCSSEDTLF